MLKQPRHTDEKFEVDWPLERKQPGVIIHVSRIMHKGTLSKIGKSEYRKYVCHARKATGKYEN